MSSTTEAWVIGGMHKLILDGGRATSRKVMLLYLKIKRYMDTSSHSQT